MHKLIEQGAHCRALQPQGWDTKDIPNPYNRPTATVTGPANIPECYYLALHGPYQRGKSIGYATIEQIELI